LFDIDQNPIAYCKNSAIKINRALSDITTKDSEGWLDFLNGIKSWSIDFDGLVSYDNDSFSTSYFISKFNNSEPFFIQFGVIQDNFIHTFFGEVAIENIDIEADNGELVTYSGSLKGIGKLQFTNQGTPEQSGYIKTETDPYFRSSPAHSITNSSIDNWNDGYNKTLNEKYFTSVNFVKDFIGNIIN
jgi:predicted secreted protein